jgi:3-oxoacyl-[acyl-carrier-protein] synthase-3
MLRYAAITGWGSYLPERVLTNADLEALVDTSDAWIRTRTGIRERRVAAPGEATASMCAAAARRALERARLDPADLDLVICASTTPDRLMPATGCLVQAQIGATRAGAFDLNAACSGFLYGLTVGSQCVRSGACERVLVAAGETLSRFLDWQDRATCVLFGDGAGAVVLEAAEQECGVLGSVLGSDGDVRGLLTIQAGGSADPASPETVRHGDHLVRMRGSEVFRAAVRRMAEASEEALARSGLGVRQVRKVIPHQANGRIVRAVQAALGLPDDQVFLNLERYGNTASASIPIALCEYLETEGANSGDHLLLTAFGGGLAWGAAVVRWAPVAALIAARGARKKRQSDARPRPAEEPADVAAVAAGRRRAP